MERQRQGLRQYGEDPGTFRRNGRAAGAAPLIPACREGRELAHRGLRLARRAVRTAGSRSLRDIYTPYLTLIRFSFSPKGGARNQR